MAEAALVGQAVGTATNFWGEQLAANDAEYTASIKANELEQNAKDALRQAADEERQIRISGAKALGNIRAGYGASGVESTSGSAMDVIQESAGAVERDALNVRYGGQLRAAAYRRGADFTRTSGEAAAARHRLSAWGTLLGGGGKTYGAAQELA